MTYGSESPGRMHWSQFWSHTKIEVAIRTAPVSEHSFAIRTAMLMHMRSEAMFNLFIRRSTAMVLKFIRTVFVRGPCEL